jgi:hypothetical protein
MELTPKAIQNVLDELEALRSSRKRAWDNLQEIRWVIKDAAGTDLPDPAEDNRFRRQDRERRRSEGRADRQLAWLISCMQFPTLPFLPF